VLCPSGLSQTGKTKAYFIDSWSASTKRALAQHTAVSITAKSLRKDPGPFSSSLKRGAPYGKKAGLADLSAGELEALKKVYNQSTSINAQMVKRPLKRLATPACSISLQN